MKKVFTGAYTGVKKFRALKNPDILHSKVKNKKFEINKLSIDRKKNDQFFVYHMINSIDGYSGRWYNTRLSVNDLDLNDKQRKLTYINPEWEDLDTGKIKQNVPITIYFTEKGWHKLKKVLRLLE
jgi:hypothetical protein